MLNSGSRQLLGVVGGMGPLASAEFLKTIYECCLGEREQESPAVVVYSDPAAPDRTDSLLKGECEILLEHLAHALSCLRELGASRLVICCVTSHYLLPRLHDDQRKNVTSLLDVIFDELLRARERHLLVCTNGTRKLELFQTHPRWQLVKDYVALPDETDQDIIHQKIIFEIKKNRPPAAVEPSLRRLLSKYEVDSFIAGCTELHVLAKHLLTSGDGGKSFGCIDPLTVIAKELAGEFNPIRSTARIE